MRETDKPEAVIDAGGKFSEALARAGIKPAEIAKLVGGYPQQVNNWKKRGVPARFAVVVGKKLGAKPEEISSEYVSEAAAHQVSESDQTYKIGNTQAVDFSMFTADELKQAIMLAMNELPAADKKVLIHHLVDSV